MELPNAEEILRINFTHNFGVTFDSLDADGFLTIQERETILKSFKEYGEQLLRYAAENTESEADKEFILSIIKEL